MISRRGQRCNRCRLQRDTRNIYLRAFFIARTFFQRATKERAGSRDGKTNNRVASHQRRHFESPSSPGGLSARQNGNLLLLEYGTAYSHLSVVVKSLDNASKRNKKIRFVKETHKKILSKEPRND